MYRSTAGSTRWRRTSWKTPPTASGCGRSTPPRSRSGAIEHEKVDTPLVEAAAVSGDIPPHVEPDPDLNPTELDPAEGARVGVQRGRLHKVRPPVHVRQQEEVGEVPPRDLPGLRAGVPRHTKNSERGGGAHPLRDVHDRRGRVAGVGRLHPVAGVPRAGAQSQRFKRAVHPHVHQRGAGTAGGERPAPDAALRVAWAADDDHDRRASPLRRPGGLRDQPFLRQVPGVRGAVSRATPCHATNSGGAVP